MPSPQGPLLPRRRLGVELRRLRGSRTLEQVASDTLISTSKLSRLENGQGAPQPRDIRDLINYYDADRSESERVRRWAAEGRRQAWWAEYSEALYASFDIYLDYEAGASVIRMFQETLIPGILQTEAYARQLVRTLYPQRTTGWSNQVVELRLRRQEMLLDDDETALRLLAVIDEAAIRRALSMGSIVDGKAQLVHLHEMSQRWNISVRIIPLNSGLHSGMMGGFNVFQFADDIDRDVVHMETYNGDRYLEEQSSVLEYLRLFDAVTGRSLDNADSRELLQTLVEAPHESQEKK
jgi:transcriptional regulator with XRE-family HTH domain